MLHVSNHPAWLYSPSLASLCPAVLRDASHTCVIPHFNLPTRDPLAFSHMHPPSFPSHGLSNVLRPTPPPCLTSPCAVVVRSAPDTCTVPHFTLLGCAALFIRHLLRPSLSSAWLCSALRLTHAQCLTSPSRTPLASLHYAWLFCAQHPTHAPRFISSMCYENLVMVMHVCRPYHDATGDAAGRRGRMWPARQTVC